MFYLGCMKFTTSLEHKLVSDSTLPKNTCCKGLCHEMFKEYLMILYNTQRQHTNFLLLWDYYL